MKNFPVYVESFVISEMEKIRVPVSRKFMYSLFEFSCQEKEISALPAKIRQAAISYAIKKMEKKGKIVKVLDVLNREYFSLC